MKKTLLKSVLRTVLVLFLVVAMQSMVTAESSKARKNRIVGVWDVQVTLLDCSTGNQLFNFPALHKYELGGTGQVVPGGTNPTALSAHMSIWKHVSGNDYELVFKMFRFDPAGNNIGWVIVRNNITINKDATQYTGSGQAEFFDPNGNSQGMSCPTFSATRFQ